MTLYPLIIFSEVNLFLFCFDDDKISFLRESISTKKYFSTEYRLNHTLGVEREAVRLGELYCPEKIPMLRVAALLHDVTKEFSFEKQLQICERFGTIISNEQMMVKKTLHAVTAALVIPEEFPLFASDEVISAVRYHTTGRGGMTLTEKIIYLADYIEEGRAFCDCVKLRNYFYSENIEKMNEEERLLHLDKALILSFDMTIEQLICEGTPIDIDTTLARNDLIARIKKSI